MCWTRKLACQPVCSAAAGQHKPALTATLQLQASPCSCQRLLLSCQHLTAPYHSLSEQCMRRVPQEGPQELAVLIDLCCQHDPAKRPTSARLVKILEAMQVEQQ